MIVACGVGFSFSSCSGTIVRLISQRATRGCDAILIAVFRCCEVLYTGGARVAKIILAAAAKTLTPVTTEVHRFSI